MREVSIALYICRYGNISRYGNIHLIVVYMYSSYNFLYDGLQYIYLLKIAPIQRQTVNMVTGICPICLKSDCVRKYTIFVFDAINNNNKRLQIQ